jgi:hypothetical protein
VWEKKIEQLLRNEPQLTRQEAEAYVLKKGQERRLAKAKLRARAGSKRKKKTKVLLITSAFESNRRRH